MVNDFKQVVYRPYEFNGQTFYEPRHPNNQRLIYRKAVLEAPFGLDNDFDKYNIKCMLNLKDNDNIDLYNFIKRIEMRNMKYLDVDEEKYKSALYIRRNKNKPIFKAFILTRNKKPYVDIMFDNEKDVKTIYDLERNSKIECDIIMGSVWKNPKAKKNKAGMSIHINNIRVIQ